MHLERSSGSGAGSGGAGDAAPPCPAASASSLQTSMQTSAADGGSPQAMQCTPRSESRTPSVHRVGGAGAGVGGSVNSGGRHRMPARPTPMRLLDALNAHPTSPSDPVLEGQLDLRKVWPGVRRAACIAPLACCCQDHVLAAHCSWHGLHGL